MSFLRRWKFHFWYSQRQNPPWDTNITPPELMEFIASHPAGRALDLGCGTGTNVITLARHGWQVTGIDFAWSAIRIARRKLQQAGVSADLQVNDVTRLNGIAGPFDLILDIGCFHNLPDAGRPAYLLQLKRLLAPAGTYLLYVHFKPEAADRGHGVVEAELKKMEAFLHLLSRQDGTDRGHHSAWLAFTQALHPT
jgi:cyclopropane fatty-acyl-phospholipid synthase-like methyltransferase